MIIKDFEGVSFKSYSACLQSLLFDIDLGNGVNYQLLNCLFSPTPARSRLVYFVLDISQKLQTTQYQTEQ